MFMFLIGFVVLTIVTIWWLVEVIADKMYGVLFNKRDEAICREIEQRKHDNTVAMLKQLQYDLGITDAEMEEDD